MVMRYAGHTANRCLYNERSMVKTSAGYDTTNIEDIRKNIPSLLVEKLEVPGMPVQEPDKASVAALIPPKRAVSKQATPSSQTTVQVVAAPSVSAQQGKIEARKNFTGMGMTY